MRLKLVVSGMNDIFISNGHEAIINLILFYHQMESIQQISKQILGIPGKEIVHKLVKYYMVLLLKSYGLILCCLVMPWGN